MWQERSIFDMENFKSRHCPVSLPVTYNHEITQQVVDKLRTILDEKNAQLRNPVVHTYTYTDIIKGALSDVDTSIVPRLFWCSWNTNTLPPVMTAHMSDLMQSHPQFTLNVYSDNDCRRLISDYFTDVVVSAFDSVIPGAFKSDLWRYCALYVFGGIYFDVKFFPVNNFNYEEFITGTNIWVRDIPCFGCEGIFNGFMVTKARNPFLLEAIMKSCRNIHAKDYRFSDLAITGPHLLREAVPIDEPLKMHLGPRLEDNTNMLYLGDRAILKGYPEYRGEQVKSGICLIKLDWSSSMMGTTVR
jgi:mannosyltransferase OCH1-like enzyme